MNIVVLCQISQIKTTNVHKTNFCPLFYENRREGFNQKYFYVFYITRLKMQRSLLKLFLHIQFCNILPALCLYFLAKKTGYSRKIQPGQLSSSQCRAKLLPQCWCYCKQEFITKISHSTQPITHRARAVSYELRYRQISQFSHEYILLYITGTYAKYGMCIYDGWLVG